MRCHKCQHDNSERANFCVECGAATAPVCSNCGTELPTNAKFCPECGRPVSAGSHGPPQHERAPRNYTPNHLAEKILTTKSALEGARKEVTVLFADVKESMALAEQVDPEVWHRILDEFFAILSDGIHRFEGTINQYTGDGIMALFGAPIAHEDHAQRACYAALYLRGELARYAEDLRRRRGLNFSVRMGLNSGDVIVGRIGDDLRMDYTAQGHTVGLAARMEGLAAADRIYLTEHTARLVAGYFQMRDLGRFEIKGVSRPLGVYELEEVGAARTRLDVSRARGFSRFVGRDSELRMLEAALAGVRSGSGGVVGVVAEAGAGKSRLCYEFAQQCRAEGMQVYEAHCVPHGRMIPYLPVLELLRDYFDIHDRDSDAKAREKIAGRLVLLDPELREALPWVFDFMGIADSHKPTPAVDAEVRRRLLYGCLERMFACRGDCAPTLLLFEDLHWLDDGSEGFLGEIIELLPRTRTLLLVNFRPEFRADWMQPPHYRELSLLPLGPAAISQLVADLLGTDSSLKGLAELIRRHTGGNPFFIEEVVQAMVDSGSLAGARGAYRLVRPVTEIVLPSTVQGVLSARIDRLGESEKTLLETAAVIGKEFETSVLERVVGYDRDEFARSLARLSAAEFVYEKALYPEQQYAFKHPLTQEVAYRSQLAGRRANTHRAVAEVVASLNPDRVDELAALIAHHWEEAGEPLQAARWSARAAELETGRDALEALRQWLKARELVLQAAVTEETRTLNLRADIAILEEAWKAGIGKEKVDAIFAEARSIADARGDVRSLARLMAAYGLGLNFTGDIHASLDYLTEAAELAARTDDDDLKLTLKGRLGYSKLLVGQLHESLALSNEVYEARGGTNVDVRMFRAYPLIYLGELEQAVRDLDAARVLIGDREMPGTLATLHGVYVTLAWFAGDRSSALTHARAQLEISERLGSATLRSSARDSLGIACLMDGQWQEAVELLEKALKIVREKATMLQGEPVMLCNLSAAYLGLGDSERAARTAADALAVARQRGTRMHQCRALLFRARALLRTETGTSRQEIRELLEQAMAIVELTGGRAYAPFIREEAAELASVTGDLAASRRELVEAQRLFVSIGAHGHAERLAALAA